MKQFHLNILKSFFLLITFLLLFISVDKLVKSTPLHEDGIQNLELAYSIAHFGTMGDVSHSNPIVVTPNNDREPFPNWLTAQWIKGNPLLFNDLNLHKSQTPEQIIKLKKISTWIVIGALFGVFFLAKDLFKSRLSSNICFISAYAAVLLSYACMHTMHVNSLITEIHGALLIIWFSWAWLKLFHTNGWQYAVLSGVFLGLLILTKAAFLYISLVVLIVTICVLLIQAQPKTLILNHALLILVSAMLVLPWMYRNYVSLGNFEVAGRGPVVLMTRAFKSQMTDEEFKGAFYAYAPASLKKTMRNLTGFNSRDRELGGRLQRFYRAYAQDEACRDLLKENCAIAYYYQASIRYRNIMRSFKQQFPHDANKAKVLGEDAAKAFAVNLIKNNPWGHLRTTLVFAWRGAWPCNTVDGRWYKSYRKMMQPAWQEILPFMGLIAMFGLAITALVKKQNELIALTWFGSATFLFYSLATHFIPRYSEMMIPIWVLCFVYGFVLIIQNFFCLSKNIKHE